MKTVEDLTFEKAAGIDLEERSKWDIIAENRQLKTDLDEMRRQLYIARTSRDYLDGLLVSTIPGFETTLATVTTAFYTTLILLVVAAIAGIAIYCHR